MNETSRLVGTENAGKLQLPENPHERDKTLFIILGVDVLNALRRMTGMPKAHLMEGVYNLKFADSQVESAKLPVEKGEYPKFVLKLMVSRRDFFSAKVFATAQRYRTQIDDESGHAITYLGFDPAIAADPAEKAGEN